MRTEVHIVRESIGRIVNLLTNRGIKVTQRGAGARVEYDAAGRIVLVNIPYLPDDASEAFILAVQGFVDHEVGHVLHSDPATLRAGVKDGARVANLHNIIEDVYIERKMTETFSGSGANLESVRHYYLEHIARPKINEALAKGDVDTATSYAVVVGFRAWGGQTTAQDFLKDPKMAALVAPIADKLGAEMMAKIGKCNSSQDCLDLARQVKKRLEKPKEEEKAEPPMSPPKPEPKSEPKPKPEPEPEDKGEGEGSSDDGEGDTEDETGKGAASEGEGAGEGEREEDDAPPEDESTASAGEDETGEGATGESTDGDEGEPGAGAEGEPDDDAEEAPGGKSDGDTEEGEGGAPPTAPSEVMPEHEPTEPDPIAKAFDEERDFDKDMCEALGETAKKELSESDYAIFSTDWDRVEQSPYKARPEVTKRLTDSAGQAVATMQKYLERAIASKARVSWNSGMRRGRVAPTALYRTALGDDRVFRQRFETHAKNTAVSLVVDCSGSMNRDDRIGTAGQTAYALSQVLERIKVTNEVIGFTTATGVPADMRAEMAADRSGVRYSRGLPLFMPVFKSFGERLDSEARARIAYLTDNPSFLYENADGECVRIAAQRLIAQRAERHVMIVLSDGAPACPPGYGMQGHLKSTVKDLESRGIDVIGIGIQSSAVAQFYTKHVVLTDLAELPTTVIARLSDALLS